MESRLGIGLSYYQEEQWLSAIKKHGVGILGKSLLSYEQNIINRVIRRLHQRYHSCMSTPQSHNNNIVIPAAPKLQTQRIIKNFHPIGGAPKLFIYNLFSKTLS